jgi:predicted thioredoxin/glutaredoxin
MVDAMRRAEAKVAPVLAVFRDQVLFLKHNLNAAALNSLAGEKAKVEADVASLIEEMNRAIAESEAFIEKMER